MRSSTDATEAVRVVAIGASAGGLGAFTDVITRLPPAFTWALVLVQHVRASAGVTLAGYLTLVTGRAVAEPEDKEPIRGGHVYVAPAGYHLLVGEDGCFHLSVDEPVRYARPSIDVLFCSVAEAFGAAAVGVVLTGANDDGAEGLARISAGGGRALVQDPREAAYDLMPRAALEACPGAEILKLMELPARLARFTRKDEI